jgi:hypothetical protein
MRVEIATANFLELRQREVRRIYLTRTRVNRGWGSAEVSAQEKSNVTVIDAVFNIVDIGTLPC